MAIDAVPIVGSSRDIYKGFRDGNYWQVALGTGGLALDLASFGSVSIIKGGIKGVGKGLLKHEVQNVAKTAAKGGTLLKQTSTKADYLFKGKSDAMNWARKQLGHNTEKMYNANGKLIGWSNSKGSVYWGHNDWGKGVGSSTFPHLNYNIGGKKGHLFLQDKITNRGMWDDFGNFFKK